MVQRVRCNQESARIHEGTHVCARTHTNTAKETTLTYKVALGHDVVGLGGDAATERRFAVVRGWVGGCACARVGRREHVWGCSREDNIS